MDVFIHIYISSLNAIQHIETWFKTLNTLVSTFRITHVLLQLFVSGLNKYSMTNKIP